VNSNEVKYKPYEHESLKTDIWRPLKKPRYPSVCKIFLIQSFNPIISFLSKVEGKMKQVY
jgi:hypothetical protein